ncbi:MAG: hypothetical protein JWR23_2800 [Mucilaginibacter sp.]|nr:hypothetical protein [Mucilaginibacter sp.]
MANRQRKRAQNIIRCFKKAAKLHLIYLVEQKISKIRKSIENTQAPSFLTYEKGKLKVLDSISKNQLLKIEFEQLMLSINTAQISFHDYNNHLDRLLNQIHVISI